MRTVVVGIAAPARRRPLVQLASRLARGADRPRIFTVHVSGEDPAVVRGAAGRVGKELARIADDVDAAYIVIGAAAPRRAIQPGPSVARALLRRARCPIAVLPDSAPAAAVEPRVMTVAYDASPESQAALELAAELARTMDAQLRLVAVTEPPGSPHGLRHTWREVRRRVREGQLRRAARALPADVPVHTQLVEGEVVDCLLDESRTDADMVLMGSHAGRWLPPWRTRASRAAQVLERAGCAVLVVPSHALVAHRHEPAAAQPTRTARPVSRPS